MAAETFLRQVGRRDSDKAKLADKVIREPELLDQLIQGLDADDAGTKYGCSKVLRIISEKEPRIIYPRFSFFASMLGSENKFLRWDSILILANLAATDEKRGFDSIFGKYFAPLEGPVMITAANVIKGGAKIAAARPELADRIAKEILKVGKAKYQTAECRNVALGHAITAFDGFFDHIRKKGVRDAVLKLVRQELKNPRNATKKKAEKFLKKRSSSIKAMRGSDLD